jgi:transcription antitermination factor NusG
MSDVQDERVWWVAHTRPRCEKKLAEYCGSEHIEALLPCYTSVKRYRGKVATFQKPLFPNYVFIRAERELARKAYQSDYVANLLEVFDQHLFQQQLADILKALEAGLEMRGLPEVKEGARVRVRAGPLQGMEGIVEQRTGIVEVLLRLDFIGQSAAVTIDAADLEMV